MISMKEVMQAAFNESVKGLASQGFQRSFSKEHSSCVYFGPDNMRCAAGWLMADGTKPLEGEDISLKTNQKCLKLEYQQNNIDFKSFLDRLQIAHDVSRTPDWMKGSLVGLAEDYQLDIPEALKDIGEMK